MAEGGRNPWENTLSGTGGGRVSLPMKGAVMMKTTMTMKPGSLNPWYPYRSTLVTGNVLGRFPGLLGSSWVRFLRPPYPSLF